MAHHKDCMGGPPGQVRRQKGGEENRQEPSLCFLLEGVVEAGQPSPTGLGLTSLNYSSGLRGVAAVLSCLVPSLRLHSRVAALRRGPGMV